VLAIRFCHKSQEAWRLDMGLKMLRVRVGIVVEQDDEQFHAFCPGLKGLHVGGATEEEALQNAKDAVYAYLCSLMKHNDPIPLGILEYEKEFSIPNILSHIFSKKPKQYTEDFEFAPA
jgi:predicted RNase H-like HicB family nuclease